MIIPHTFANAPESRKRGCVMPQDVRAARLMGFFNQVGTVVGATAESGTFLEAEIEKNRLAWRATYGPPNDHVNGRDIGNGQISRKSIRCVQWRDLQFDKYHEPVRMYRAEDVEWAVISLHLPGLRADPLSKLRKPMTEMLVDYSARLNDLGINHVVTGDTNSGKSWDQNFPWLNTAIRHKVDTMLVSSAIKVPHSTVFDRPRLSDHMFIHANLNIPKGTTGRRLPRP